MQKKYVCVFMLFICLHIHEHLWFFSWFNLMYSSPPSTPLIVSHMWNVYVLSKAVNSFYLLTVLISIRKAKLYKLTVEKVWKVLNLYKKFIFSAVHQAKILENRYTRITLKVCSQAACASATWKFWLCHIRVLLFKLWHQKWSFMSSG